MNMHIKPGLYILVFALLTVFVLVELAVGFVAAWIALTVLAGVGVVLLVLTDVLKGTPSLHPATWVFLISYNILAIGAAVFYAFNSWARLTGVAVVAAGLGILWYGTRRKQCWAWNWTRRIYTVLTGCLFLRVALVPFRPGVFLQEYVSDLGWILGIAIYLLNLALTFGIIIYVWEAFRTPADAKKPPYAITGSNA